MGSITLTASADVACWTNEAYAAGLGPHLPVGYWGSATYRSGIRFTAPSWAGWTRITKATLNVYISDHAHVGVRNSTVLVRRQNVSGLWTKSAGTQDCNDGFSASNNTQNSDLTSSSTNQVTFSSGTTANAKKAITVTDAVSYYFSNKTSVLVFTFAGNSSSDYTELWSREKGSTYDATLVIEYEDDTVPNAPTLTSPGSGEVVASQQPTLSWAHNDPQGNPQVSAEVSLNGVNLYTVGSEQSIVVPDVLNRGQTYEWLVRTADSLGYGAWSASRTFVVAGYVVPTVTAKYLVWNNGWPRPRLFWTWSPPDGRYATQHRVLWDGYDTGWIAGNPGDHTASSWNTTENQTLTNVRVWVQDSFGIVSEAVVGNWTTRFGVSQHRKDLGTIPLSWGTPVLEATLPGSGSAVIIQYGANSSGTSDPTAWYDSLSSVPKNQFLFIKYWFLHSTDLRMPTVHKHVVPTSNTADAIDHWTIYQNTPFGPPWSLDSGEYVYGTRSVSCVPDSTPDMWKPGLRSEPMQLRAGRSYIITGLMKSQGNSGASISIMTPGGEGLATTPAVTETRDWFKKDNLDTYRYKSPVYVSPIDQQVYAYLAANPSPEVKGLMDPDEGATLAGWSSNASAFGIEDGSGGIPSAGWGSFFVFNFTGPDQWGVYVDPASRCPITQGKTYKMRGLFMVDVDGLNASAAWLDASGTYIGSGGGRLLPAAGWTWYDFDLGVPPANAAFACFAINSGSSDSRWHAADRVTIYEGYSTQAWFDAIKLEESTVATPWSPGAVGASAVDAGGVQIDGSKGAVFRYRGSSGGANQVVEGSLRGLRFGNVELAGSDAGGTIDVISHSDNVGVAVNMIANGAGSPTIAMFNSDFSSRVSIWSDKNQLLSAGGSIRAHAMQQNGIQNTGTNGDGFPALGRVAYGTISGLYQAHGVACYLTTRYESMLVQLTIISDGPVGTPLPASMVRMTVRRMSEAANSRVFCTIVTRPDGWDWTLWAGPMGAWDHMRIYPIAAMPGANFILEGEQQYSSYPFSVRKTFDFQAVDSIPASSPTTGVDGRWVDGPRRVDVSGDGVFYGAVEGNTDAFYGLSEIPLNWAGKARASAEFWNAAGGGTPSAGLYFLGRRASTPVGGFDYVHGAWIVALPDSGEKQYISDVEFDIAADEVAGYFRIDMFANDGVGPSFRSALGADNLIFTAAGYSGEETGAALYEPFTGVVAP